jgi:hypothetical protein
MQYLPGVSLWRSGHMGESVTRVYRTGQGSAQELTLLLMKFVINSDSSWGFCRGMS